MGAWGGGSGHKGCPRAPRGCRSGPALVMTSLLSLGPPIRLSAFLDVNRPRTSRRGLHEDRRASGRARATQRGKPPPSALRHHPAVQTPPFQPSPHLTHTPGQQRNFSPTSRGGPRLPRFSLPAHPPPSPMGLALTEKGKWTWPLGAERWDWS